MRMLFLEYRPKMYFLLFLVFITATCSAQEKQYLISKPLDMKPKGWNRVLCMNNGNTMLFHFETFKNITVKVFDSTGKQIASRDDFSRVLDFFTVGGPDIKGIFEVNGEAVLFLTRSICQSTD